MYTSENSFCLEKKRIFLDLNFKFLLKLKKKYEKA